MTLQAEDVYINQNPHDAIESSAPTTVSIEKKPVVDEEQQYRASAYALIAALLRSPPDQELLHHVAGLTQDTQAEGDDLLLSMSSLGVSAKLHTPEVIEDEFHSLFIGLGKGEVVPYASWYLTGFLMEKPLSDLRQNLVALGYQKSATTCEPEDHAAAICEVMSMIILEGKDYEKQNAFFQAHLICWLGRFFNDLSNAKSAIFYKALSRFGSAFLMLENEYFSMQT